MFLRSLPAALFTISPLPVRTKRNSFEIVRCALGGERLQLKVFGGGLGGPFLRKVPPGKALITRPPFVLSDTIIARFFRKKKMSTVISDVTIVTMNTKRTHWSVRPFLFPFALFMLPEVVVQELHYPHRIAQAKCSYPVLRHRFSAEPHT